MAIKKQNEQEAESRHSPAGQLHGEAKDDFVNQGNFKLIFACVIVLSVFFGAILTLSLLPANTAPTGNKGTGNAAIVSDSEISSKLEKYMNDNMDLVVGQKYDFTISDINRLSDNLYFAIATGRKDGNVVGAIPICTTPNADYFVLGCDLRGSFKTSENIPRAGSAPVNPETDAAEEFAKTDKPKVELFIMSHCPYGTQVEKGMLPVVNLLGSKMDFEVKFVYYAMHGETEVKEQLNQYCIQKEQNSKYLSYLACFLKEGNGASCLSETGVDVNALTACTTAADSEFNVSKNLADTSSYLSGRFPLFDIHKEDNRKYNVAGSPAVIINGTQYKGGRDSESILGAVCSSFNNAPSECSENLPSEAPSPGFGFSGTASSNSSAEGCKGA